MFYLSSNRRSVGEFAKGKGGKVAGVKNLGNGWSKSIKSKVVTKSLSI